MKAGRLLLLLAGLLLASTATAPRVTGATAPATPTLVGIRAAHHPGLDRVVFDFAGGLPASRQVTYVNQLIGDGSGLPVPIAGRAILQVRLNPANAHDESGHSTAPRSIAFPLPNVMTAVRSGDFEAVTTYGVGLAKKQPFRVFTLTGPPRLVIDVDAAFPTMNRKVYFFNQPRFDANHEPFFTPVLRPVLPGTPATGVMDRLFAGPLPSETSAGLRLLRSEATGFTGLRIANRVAKVQLVGGCNSRGSTVTIGGEILPTLRQFPTVSFVKIYDPAGNTENPTGRSDSIPACLEP